MTKRIVHLFDFVVEGDGRKFFAAIFSQSVKFPDLWSTTPFLSHSHILATYRLLTHGFWKDTEYTRGWLIIAHNGTIINCQGSLGLTREALVRCKTVSCLCWCDNIHLGTIERFVLESLGVLCGTAVRVTTVKWETFRSPHPGKCKYSQGHTDVCITQLVHAIIGCLSLWKYGLPGHKCM